VGLGVEDVLDRDEPGHAAELDRDVLGVGRLRHGGGGRRAARVGLRAAPLAAGGHLLGGPAYGLGEPLPRDRLEHVVDGL
jgi:hypothetical protein